jgi:ADP-ribose pyrophosphatase YjhB (NUDIX family)
LPGVTTPRGPVHKEIPAGDNRERLVCRDCGFIDYENPKVVVGSVATWQGRLLLCRRAIEPRHGFWTIPAGFLESHESVEAGALREAREEANVELELDGLLAVYSIPRISQVQLIFRGRLREPVFSPGAESLEVELFDWERIPWSDLAFPSVTWALEQFEKTRHLEHLVPGGNPPEAA